MTSILLEIRKYIHEKDWISICEIHDKARLIELEGSASLKAFIPLEDCYKDEELLESIIYVGLSNNNIVGFVAYDKCDITWLYIKPSLHRKGYGRQLLCYVLKKIKSNPTVTVLNNNLKALNLYTSLGFEIMEKKKGSISGTNFPAIGYKMKKTL